MDRDNLENLGIDGRVILKWMFKKCDGEWTELSGSEMGQVAVAYEYGNEPSASIKCGEFHD